MRCSRRASVLFVTTTVAIRSDATANRKSESCSCGYYDATAGVLWTESIIVYFNETTATPARDFIEETYTHKYEKGWNTQFRTGADVSNIKLSNSTSSSGSPRSLELYVSPYTSDHLVVGSSVRTSRQDIQYGSFTSFLQSPGKHAGGGGSVLSFSLEYSSSQSASINLQNTDMPNTASISTLINEESEESSLPSYENATDGKSGHGPLPSWDYKEYRIDWMKSEVNFFIGGMLVRSVSRSKDDKLLSVPSPLHLRHWSNGLTRGSQGPPTQSTVANIGWVRLFFNSSLMAENEHANFDSRCRTYLACPTTDMMLRGSSSYSEESTKEWKQIPENRPRRTVAIWLAVACISLTTLLLLSPLWTRIRERLHLAKENDMTPEARRESMCPPHSRAASAVGLGIELTTRSKTTESSIGSFTLVETTRSSPTAASFNPSRSSTTGEKHENSRTFRRRSAYLVDTPPSEDEWHVEGETHSEQKALSDPLSSKVSSAVKGPNLFTSSDRVDLTDSSMDIRKEQELKSSPIKDAIMSKNWRISWHNVGWKDGGQTAHSTPLTTSPTAPETAAPDSPKKEPDVTTNITGAFPSLMEGQQRVAYLAGLLVVSCLLVTAINFNLTYIYGDLVPDRFTHFHSEDVARKTIAPFLLNQIWIGPFLLTSARFLTTNYMRTGDLLAIAEKTVKRTFRLMLPATAMVMLEYFFIECGATKWLEYLPSITWSTWPFIKSYSNFAEFLSEVLELIFLIPNAAPLITFNYCTHVLWTMPVQLQGSWTALLAIIIVREIKNPWKRFGFYAFCIGNHWYALSWGSYFYFGVMITDLSISYKWQPYLHARPLMYYPLLLLCISFVFAGPTLDLFTQRNEVDYAAYEYSIHSNVTTGLPISESSRAVSPVYFVPRLNGLVFAVGLQAAVELSPAIQKMFSFKLLMLIFPHIFTIYLLHGFIFWTFGPWLCIFLAVRGLSYSSNILIVALCCYSVLALTTPVVTLVLDCLGKSITTDIWRQAREEPAPRHPTLYPFPKDLFLNRYEISWKRKTSDDDRVAEQEHKVSRAIPRDRKPSKDVRSWYEGTPASSSPNTSSHERQPSGSSNVNSRGERVLKAIPRDRKPSKDLRTSWYENQLPSASPRSSWYETESSTARRALTQDQEPSVDPRTSWHERHDNRTSWYGRRVSNAAKLDRVDDVDEEPEV